MVKVEKELPDRVPLPSCGAAAVGRHVAASVGATRSVSSVTAMSSPLLVYYMYYMAAPRS